MLTYSLFSGSARSNPKGYAWDDYDDQTNQPDLGATGIGVASSTGEGIDSSVKVRSKNNRHSRPLQASTTNPNGTMPDKDRETRTRDRFRQRSSTKASVDSGSSKNRSRQQPSQKVMLSKALQRANLAVQLDKQQNFEGARESYAEACELLEQVLQRTHADDDKRKLEAIVSTHPYSPVPEHLTSAKHVPNLKDGSGKPTPAGSPSWTRCSSTATMLFLAHLNLHSRPTTKSPFPAPQTLPSKSTMIKRYPLLRQQQ